jgi:hypothetical protein
MARNTVTMKPYQQRLLNRISRRMAKKQQMRWTKKGAHLLLQLRIKTLNDDLHNLFIKWYPGMGTKNESLPHAA